MMVDIAVCRLRGKHCQLDDDASFPSALTQPPPTMNALQSIQSSPYIFLTIDGKFHTLCSHHFIRTADCMKWRQNSVISKSNVNIVSNRCQVCATAQYHIQFCCNQLTPVGHIGQHFVIDLTRRTHNEQIIYYNFIAFHSKWTTDIVLYSFVWSLATMFIHTPDWRLVWLHICCFIFKTLWHLSHSLDS